jgi:hypothetical protein
MPEAFEELTVDLDVGIGGHIDENGAACRFHWGLLIRRMYPFSNHSTRSDRDVRRFE